MNNVILFTTHFINDTVINHFNMLKSQIKDADIYILFDNSVNECSLDENIYYINKKVAEDHNFKMHYYYCNSPIKKDFYGNNFEYGIYCFYLDHPEYDNYWLIEYDVIYTGNFNDLILKYEKDDFVTSNILTIKQSPFWYFWQLARTYLNYKTFKPTKFIKSFNPIFKISNKVLKDLIKLNNDGNYGFYEIYFPTTINYLGYTIKQFDELIGNNQDVIGSSMRFLDHGETISKELMKENILYHPVKN